MFPIFEQEKIATIGMFSCLMLSLLTRLLLGIIYQNMIRETDNMSATNNKLLKQCKLKFANCYQLNNGVANIPVFVDKFLNRLSFGPFTFETLYHVSGQLMLLSIVFSGIGVCKSIIKGSMLGQILPFYIISLFGLYIYFAISSLVDIKGKKRILKVNLVDYLENHLSARIDVTEEDMHNLYGHGALRKNKKTVELMPISNRIAIDGDLYKPINEDTTPIVDGLRKEVRKVLNNEEDNSHDIFTKAQEQELEELLKEFLTS